MEKRKRRPTWKRNWEKKNPDKAKEMWKKANDKWIKKNPNYFRDWQRKNRERHNENCNRWQRENYDKVLGYKKIHMKKYLARMKANIKINITGIKCVICDKNPAKHKHHIDYLKPYEIIPCCTQCHALIHKNLNNKNNKL